MRNVKSIINLDAAQNKRGSFISNGGNTTQLKEKARCAWTHLTDFALTEVSEKDSESESESGENVIKKDDKITINVNSSNKVIINSYFRIGLRQLDSLR